MLFRAVISAWVRCRYWPDSKLVREIDSPDSKTTFTMEINEGMNVCELMQKARDEGKIASITFDDSYLATFNSRLITEINGFKNNWVFTVNGESPDGCSLSILKPNDKVVWTFL